MRELGLGLWVVVGWGGGGMCSGMYKGDSEGVYVSEICEWGPPDSAGPGVS